MTAQGRRVDAAGERSNRLNEVVIGLTGGIGSGKSTVAGMLAAHGAVIADADEIAREVTVPGTAAYAAIVDRFGMAVLEPDGEIKREKLAEAVFGNESALRALNEITHPAIGVVLAERRAKMDGRKVPGVVVIPLFRPYHRAALRLSEVVVVDCPVEMAIRRLVSARGMAQEQARARVAAQIDREERLALADWVVDNGGERAALASEVERLWAHLAARLKDGS